MTATYEYSVRDRSGNLRSGRIEASSSGVVAAKLKARGYAPISIDEANTGLNREINLSGLRAKVKLKDLAVLSRSSRR